MALSSPIWKNWITSPIRGGARTASPAIYFRREFSLAKKPKGKVALHLAVLGIADCEINGERISADTLTSWPDYRFRVYYRSYDVTHCVKKGENAIGVTLGNGWYSGHVAACNRQYYGEHPLFSLSLMEDSKGKHSVLLSTDKKWRYNDHGPIIENDLFTGESYDARLELGAWSLPEYDDKGWHRALVAETPKIAIEPAIAPAIRPQETFKGRLITDNSKNSSEGFYSQIFDFGQNLAGRVRLRVKAPRGLNFTLRPAEMLEANGKLHTANLRSIRPADNYTCKGNGKWKMENGKLGQPPAEGVKDNIPYSIFNFQFEEWEPRFTFHGFRYCEVTWPHFGNEKDVPVEIAVEAVALYSDLPKTGELECSHPLLNQLISNTCWSQKSNFLDIPTDCPQRDERCGWTGDAQAFIRTAAFFLDVDTFFRQWLTTVRDTQSINDGAIPPFAPHVTTWGNQPKLGGPGWGDAIFICPWTAYLCYGDTAILRENFDAMRTYLDYIERHECAHGVRCHPDTELGKWLGWGDWLAIDRQGNPVNTSYPLIGTAFHAYGAELTARTAEVIGEDAAPFWKLHAQIVETFRTNFLDARGMPIEQTQTAYVLPLQFRLVPDEARQAVGDRLAALVKENDYHMNTGFLGTPYLLCVLEDTGHLDTAYRILTQEAFPSWLFPVKNGATTIWERWDAWTLERGFHPDGMNSFNHYAYGAVCAWMVTTMAGLELDPAEPAYRHIVFKPRPGGGITHARASLQTRYGHTSIAWELRDNALHLTLDVPEGAYATLSLPPEYKNTAPERIERGRHEFTMMTNR